MCKRAKSRFRWPVLIAMARTAATANCGDLNDKAFLALVSDEVLRRYIITGRHDLGMPNFADSIGRDKATSSRLPSSK